jgi:hypothetical protein
VIASTLGLAVALFAAPATAAEPPFVQVREDPAWQARRRQLRTGTAIAVTATGLTALGLGVSSAVVWRSKFEDRDARVTRGVMGPLLLASMVALIFVGRAWELHEEDGRRMRPSGLADPRGDPRWLRRDRGFTGAMLGTGAFAGAMSAAALGQFVRHISAPCPADAAVGCQGPPVTAAALGGVAAAGVLGFTGVAIARGLHRRKIRRWRAQLVGGGLQLRF